MNEMNKKKYLTVETIPKSIEKLYKDAKSIPLTHIYITAHWILFVKWQTKEVKNVKIFFVNVWRKTIFDIYVTEYGTALTTILPILFLYLNTVTVTAGTFEP